MGKVKAQNWKRTITYYANSVEVVESVDDIIRIVKDKECMTNLECTPTWGKVTSAKANGYDPTPQQWG